MKYLDRKYQKLIKNMCSYNLKYFSLLTVFSIFYSSLALSATEEEKLLALIAGKLVAFHIYEETLEDNGCYTFIQKKRILPVNIVDYLIEDIEPVNNFFYSFNRKAIEKIIMQKRAKSELQVFEGLERHVNEGYSYKQSCTIIYNKLHHFFDVKKHMKKFKDQKKYALSIAQ